MRENRSRNKQAVKNREAQHDSLPGPVAAGSNRPDHDHKRSTHCNLRRNAEETEAGADSDELGHEGEKISDNEIAHGEKAPEAPEAVEDKLGMAPVRNRAEPHGHLLDDETHNESEHDEREKEADSEACAVGRVR